MKFILLSSNYKRLTYNNATSNMYFLGRATFVYLNEINKHKNLNKRKEDMHIFLIYEYKYPWLITFKKKHNCQWNHIIIYHTLTSNINNLKKSYICTFKMSNILINQWYKKQNKYGYNMTHQAVK